MRRPPDRDGLILGALAAIGLGTRDPLDTALTPKHTISPVEVDMECEVEVTWICEVEVAPACPIPGEFGPHNLFRGSNID